MTNLNGILGEDFDAREHDTGDGDFDVIPPGVYEAEITGSELKDTNAGDGKYISLEYTILGPNNSGRKVWHNLNIVNKNDKAVKISKSQLSKIALSVGVPVLKDTSQLHQKPMKIKIAVKKGTEKYPEDRNEIKSFYALDEQPSSSGGGSDSSKAPWQR